MKKSPLLLSFIGPSGSGKTTLIIKIIERLTRLGLKVGAVKRSHHKVDIDIEGKDSWRFNKAGSNPTLLISGHFWGYMENMNEPADLGQVSAQFEGKVDIVLIEGFKKEGSTPKLMFINSKTIGAQGEPENDNVAGYITISRMNDETEYLKKPLFHRDDPDMIARWITGLVKKS